MQFEYVSCQTALSGVLRNDLVHFFHSPVHRSLDDIEYEQVQLALAMSASLNGEALGSREELPKLPPAKGKRKRTRWFVFTFRV